MSQTMSQFFLNFKREICDVRTKLVKALLDVVIASVLKSWGPLSGYKTIEYIYRVTKVFTSPSLIYPILNQMERKDLIEKMMVNNRGGVYKLTVKGEKWLFATLNDILKLQSYLNSMVNHSPEKDIWMEELEILTD